MRALTVCDPWATGLIFGPKRIENRPRTFNHRGRLCICVGKAVSWYTDENCGALHALWRDFPQNRVAALAKYGPHLGHAIGDVDVVDCLPATHPRLAGLPYVSGPMCLVTERPRAYRYPFPVRGLQCLFTVPDADINAAEPYDLASVREPRVAWVAPDPTSTVGVDLSREAQR